MASKEERRLTKLINQGIRITDVFFEDLKKRVSQDAKLSKDLGEFLVRTDDYTTGNIFASSGYAEGLSLLVMRGVDTRGLRLRQREILLQTIRNTTTSLITDVGEEVKYTIRQLAGMSYQTGEFHPDKLARELEPLLRNEYQDTLENKVKVRLWKKYGDTLTPEQMSTAMNTELDRISKTRARTIARTEIKRSQSIADYVSSKDAGCTHFKVSCMDSACELCKEEYNGKEFDINTDIDILPPFHPNCYDGKTMVFTGNGWKYFMEITESDEILSLNPQTNETEFLKPSKIIRHQNSDGFMYHIHNKWFDTCVTPDHDCFIHQRRDGGKKGRYMDAQFRKPSELNSESKFLRCIDTDRTNPETINVNGLEFTPEDYAFFMAWYISEGSVLHDPNTAKQHSYPIKITQEISENRELLETELKRIFNGFGLRVAVGKNYFEVYSKELWDYLKPLGKSHEKHIPSEVFTLNKDCLKIFLDNYIRGDGHERTSSNELVTGSKEVSLYTSSVMLRDDLSYLILLCGYCPSIFVHSKRGTIVKHRNGDYIQNYDVWGIRVNRTKYANVKSCSIDKIKYDGMVYCVELPKYHTLWVMRNGKTSWNGNCRCVPIFYIKK